MNKTTTFQTFIEDNEEKSDLIVVKFLNLYDILPKEYDFIKKWPDNIIMIFKNFVIDQFDKYPEIKKALENFKPVSQKIEKLNLGILDLNKEKLADLGGELVVKKYELSKSISENFDKIFNEFLKKHKEYRHLKRASDFGFFDESYLTDFRTWFYKSKKKSDSEKTQTKIKKIKSDLDPKKTLKTVRTKSPT